ncbi:MAG: hypothetical protein J0I06_09415 [Planctomycetes bacterium]|nr:hypothetical protein [Planctomycetota bacterium]
MSPPLPAGPSRQASLVDCLSCLSVVVGASAGATWGGLKYGWLGGVLGLPAGAVLGVFAMIAVVVASALVLLPLVILFTEGPRGLWEFVRGRWEPPGAQPGGHPAPDDADEDDEGEDESGDEDGGDDRS